MQYLLSLKLSHLARASLNNSIELAAAEKKPWIGDVLIAAKKMPSSIPPLDFPNATEKSIEGYRKLVERNAEEWLQQQVDKSDKLYMLHGRREPQKVKWPEAFFQKGLFLCILLELVSDKISRASWFRTRSREPHILDEASKATSKISAGVF
jgi:hypothetical protein